MAERNRPAAAATVTADGKGGKRESIAPARLAAFRVLIAVGQREGHSDDLLHRSGAGAALHGLNEVDRNLATALVMGVLRWQIALDARLRELFARPDSEVHDAVMVALRLGAFQLLHLQRIPAHAALSESVALVRAAGQDYATGMVNAVLRKIAAGPRQASPKIYETVPAMAERLGHPAWLVERWVAAYGRVSAQKICQADQDEPTRSGVLAAPDEERPMMDEGSRLVAEIAAAELAAEQEGARVWDSCAAPGGKTAVLARRLPKAEILATDVSPRRLRAMEQRLGSAAVSAGVGGTVRCVVADATALPIEEGEFDLVLCDVPCSGTGTLSRNPEIRFQLAAGELPRQSKRQREILHSAMQRVREGGRLVYSTCSLEPEECEQVIDRVLAENPAGWERRDVGEALRALRERGMLAGDLTDAVRNGALRTLPGTHPMDGFFAVVLARR